MFQGHLCPRHQGTVFLPNVWDYGRSFILNVVSLKPSAIRCNVQKLHFSQKCVCPPPVY